MEWAHRQNSRVAIRFCLKNARKKKLLVSLRKWCQKSRVPERLQSCFPPLNYQGWYCINFLDFSDSFYEMFWHWQKFGNPVNNSAVLVLAVVFSFTLGKFFKRNAASACLPALQRESFVQNLKKVVHFFLSPPSSTGNSSPPKLTKFEPDPLRNC